MSLQAIQSNTDNITIPAKKRTRNLSIVTKQKLANNRKLRAMKREAELKAKKEAEKISYNDEIEAKSAEIEIVSDVRSKDICDLSAKIIKSVLKRTKERTVKTTYNKEGLPVRRQVIESDPMSSHLLNAAKMCLDRVDPIVKKTLTLTIDLHPIDLDKFINDQRLLDTIHTPEVEDKTSIQGKIDAQDADYIDVQDKILQLVKPKTDNANDNNDMDDSW